MAKITIFLSTKLMKMGGIYEGYMLIKPYGNDLWFRIRQRSLNPDWEALNFASKGEFSPQSDIAFEKHINRLIKLANAPYIQKLNGNRIKVIRGFEPLWL